MDRNRISVFFVTFYIFGMSSYSPNTRCSNYVFLWCCSCLILLQIEVVVSVIRGNVLNLEHNSGAAFLIFISLKLVHVIAAWQSVINRRNEARIFEEFTNIDDLFVSKFYQWMDFGKSKRKIILKTLPAVITNIACVVSIIALLFTLNIKAKLPWLWIGTSQLIRLRYVQYIYVVSIVAEKLEFLKNNCLLILSRKTRIEKVYVLKCVFHKIGNIQNDINRFFGWSLLFMIFTSLAQVVWVLNWIVLVLDNAESRNKASVFIKTSIIVVPELISLASSCKVCQECEDIVKEITRTVAKAESQIFEYKHCLEDFSLQIMHNPINFSARGFFSLNLKTFAAMIVTVITQLFVLLQFSMDD